MPRDTEALKFGTDLAEAWAETGDRIEPSAQTPAVDVADGLG